MVWQKATKVGHLTTAPRDGDWVEPEPAGNAVEHRRRLGAKRQDQ